MSPQKRRTTALALGGGGARGLAHVGVLEVLAENGLRPDRVAGVSVGSIVGAAYAFEPDLEKLLPRSMAYLESPQFRRYVDRVEDGRKHPAGEAPPAIEEETPSFLSRLRGYFRAERVFHRMLTSNSLLDGAILKDVVEHVLPDADVADAVVPLTIVALDLVTGREVEITRGPLRTAVLGSASLPGIFPPVRYGGCLLADIGVLSAVPCHAAKRTGVDAVVAVDVTQKVRVRRRFSSAVEVLLRMEDVAGALFRDLVLQHADVVVRPDVAGYDWTDFGSIDAVVAAGRAAARASLPELVAAMRGAPVRNVS
jgi:NTE family protein